MKILILMPLDEQHVFTSADIFRAMPKEVQEITFAMPMFMEYAVQTKTSKNWEYAFFDSILSAKAIYKTAAVNNENLIIIGNIPLDCTFDAIFNVQDLEKDLPYIDNFAAKMKTISAGEKDLEPLTILHEAKESTFTMHNAQAIADFITAYIKTDPHLDEIKNKYKDVLKFKNE